VSAVNFSFGWLMFLSLFLLEVGWVQLDILPANATTYELSAEDGAIYRDIRISAFNQFGMSAPTPFEGFLFCEQ